MSERTITVIEAGGGRQVVIRRSLSPAQLPVLTVALADTDGRHRRDLAVFSVSELALLTAALPALVELAADPTARSGEPDGASLAGRLDPPPPSEESCRPVVSVTVPDELWEPNPGLDDPRIALHATLMVNATPMHLEAWQVEDTGDDELQQVREPYGEDFEHLHTAVHGDGAFETTSIAGRRYVLLATPYCT